MRSILCAFVLLFLNASFAKDSVQTDLEDYLNKQELFCESPGCPDYLAKIVVASDAGINVCTGFLTGNNILATSASCLSKLSIENGADCSENVFIFFAGSPKAERVGCETVLEVSKNTSEDPILWTTDIAYLKLSKQMDLHSVPMSREGMQNENKFQLWSVEQIGDQVGIMRRQVCEAVHNSFINPLANNVSSPSMLLASCYLYNGSAGAPLVDFRGNVRGIVSQDLNGPLRDFIQGTGLLTGPLKNMIHASNIACATTIPQTDVLDEKECHKQLDMSILDRLRYEMLNSDHIINMLMRRLEDEVSTSNKYLQFGAKVEGDQNDFQFAFYPKCFKNVPDWIQELKLKKQFTFETTFPKFEIKRTLDSYGRINFMEKITNEDRFLIQFSPRILAQTQRSTVHFANEGEVTTYSSVGGCSN